MIAADSGAALRAAPRRAQPGVRLFDGEADASIGLCRPVICEAVTQGDSLHPIVPVFTGWLAGFGRFVAAATAAMVEHGPEVLAGLAELQVDAEHARLLEAEWEHHPLLDFIKWQDASVAQIMALTMPEQAVRGHAKLAQLLRPVCTAPAVLDELERVLLASDIAGFAADEFRDGLEHVRAGELDRALTRLTIGLEGLLRISVVNQGLLSETDVRRIESGSELVKRLWPERSGYKAYMKSWVFGMANVYRHGGDVGNASEQALHVLCAAAIWADQIMRDPAAFEQIRDGLDQEVTRQFAAGSLQLQPTADLRLRRAAAAAEKSGVVDQLLELRGQLLEVRDRRRHPDPRAEPLAGVPLGSALDR
jgi:hypothetical protein